MWVTMSLALLTVLGVGSIAVVGIGRLAANEATAERTEAATAVVIALRGSSLAIQAERSMAERWLERASQESRQDFVAAQSATDGQLEVVRRVWAEHEDVIGDGDTPTLGDIVDSVERLPMLRDALLRGGEHSSIAAYGGVVEVTSAATRRMEVLAGDSPVAPRIRAAVRIIEAGEALSEQRDIAFKALASENGVSQDELIRIAQLEQLARTNLGSIRVISADLGSRVNAFLASMRVGPARELIQAMVAGDDVQSDDWHQAATSRLDGLRSVGDDVEHSLRIAVDGLYASATRARALWSIGLVALTVVSVVGGAGAVVAARQRATALREYGVLASGLYSWFSVNELKAVGGVRVAARYDAASEYTRAGGDWYDAYPIDPRRVAITVGDVAGHGAMATAHMAMVRNLLRGITLGSSRSPASHLATLDDALRGSDIMATVFHAQLDVETGELTYARAGHPVGLLRRETTVTLLDNALGSPVGVDSSAEYADVRVRLASSCQIVVFTDGLVETRDRAVEETIAVLADRFALAVGSVEEIADHLIGGREVRQDDTALLVVSWEPGEVSLRDGSFQEGSNLVEGPGEQTRHVDL